MSLKVVRIYFKQLNKKKLYLIWLYSWWVRKKNSDIIDQVSRIGPSKYLGKRVREWRGCWMGRVPSISIRESEIALVQFIRGAFNRLVNYGTIGISTIIVWLIQQLEKKQYCSFSTGSMCVSECIWFFISIAWYHCKTNTSTNLESALSKGIKLWDSTAIFSTCLFT